MREKKKGDKHTHRVDHHAFAVRDEGRGHLCSRARSDVYAVHVKLRAATTHTTSARVFAAAPCFPPCVACRCWLFLSRHGRHGSHAKTNEKKRKRNRAWIVQRTTEARSERAEDPWSKRCCLSDGTAFSAAVCDPRRPSSSFLVAPRLVSAALVAFRPFPSLEFLPRLALIPHLCVLPYSLTRLTCSFSSSISRFSKPLLPCVTPSLFLSFFHHCSCLLRFSISPPSSLSPLQPSWLPPPPPPPSPSAPPPLPPPPLSSELLSSQQSPSQS